MSLRISVALCTYNGERFLEQQLRSIVEQRRAPDELVICDDASRDNTVELARDVLRSAPFPVRLRVNEHNLGSAKNFERAIRMCEGEIIALADQDDVWAVDKLARMEHAFLACPDTDLVFTDAVVVNESLEPLGYGVWDAVKFSSSERREVDDGNAIRALLRHNVVTGATMAFRAELRSLLLPLPSEGVHDAWIALLIAATGRVRRIRAQLIKYRQHGANQIGARRLDLFERLRRPCERSLYEARNALIQFQHARERLHEANAPVRPEVLRDFDRKILHVRRRLKIALRERGWIRLMLRESLTGRYHRYSVGLWSIGHDLVKCSSWSKRRYDRPLADDR